MRNVANDVGIMRVVKTQNADGFSKQWGGGRAAAATQSKRALHPIAILSIVLTSRDRCRIASRCSHYDGRDPRRRLS